MRKQNRLINRIKSLILSLRLKYDTKFTSGDYWNIRYSQGEDSGDGSYDEFAKTKASFINNLVQSKGIGTVIEFGFGDGNQLSLAKYPRYLGFDVSTKAKELCEQRFKSDKTKKFKLIDDYDGESAELSMSLDVIYHLIEDSVFDRYMEMLFGSAEKYVLIYSSNTNEKLKTQAPHVRHRKFTDWIEANAADWMLVEQVKNKAFDESSIDPGFYADFFIYHRK